MFNLAENKTLIMGILNATPDSFSDGGQYNNQDNALKQVEKMLSSGADIIDIGGESTRPGSEGVSIQVELDRVIPLIEKIKNQHSCVISIDTSKPEVMQEAINAGAELINDVRALEAEGALEVAKKLNVPVCLMHMQGKPKTMQQQPKYHHIVQDVLMYLLNRAGECQKRGIPKAHIILDPGFGFGKTLTDNFILLKKLSLFCQFDYPILVGLSRKSMLGTVLDLPVNERLQGSIASATYAVLQGAKIVRVHDVKETAQALKIIDRIKYET